jgi:hypothetical protein
LFPGRKRLTADPRERIDRRARSSVYGLLCLEPEGPALHDAMPLPAIAFQPDLRVRDDVPRTEVGRVRRCVSRVEVALKSSVPRDRGSPFMPSSDKARGTRSSTDVRRKFL